MKKALSLIVFLTFLVTGCATPAIEPAKHFASNEIVAFDGFVFKIEKLKVHNELPAQSKRLSTKSAGKWLAVMISVKNVTNTPIDLQFHPAYKLRSSIGSVYVEDKMLSYAANRETGYSPMQPINPNLEHQRAMIFQVPPGAYSLEVFAPRQIKSTLLRSTTQGNRFFFDLPTVE